MKKASKPKPKSQPKKMSNTTKAIAVNQRVIAEEIGDRPEQKPTNG